MTMPEYLSRDVEEQDDTESTAESNLRNSFIDKLIDLIRILIERLEGSETGYEYHYGEGWKEEQEKTAEERLKSDDWKEKIEAAEQLIDRYGRKEE